MYCDSGFNWLITIALAATTAACALEPISKEYPLSSYFSSSQDLKPQIEPFDWAEGNSSLSGMSKKSVHLFMREKNKRYAMCANPNNPNDGILFFNLQADTNREEFERYQCQSAAQKKQMNQVIGTFRHQLSCVYGPGLLLNSYLAKEFANPSLYSTHHPSFLTRQELADLSLKASQALRDDKSLQWNLIATFLKSSALAKSRDTAISGVFIERNALLSDFKEFETAEKLQSSSFGERKFPKNATQELTGFNKLAEQKKTWSAYQTASWQLVTDRRPIKQIITAEKRFKGIQLTEIMGDLADLAVIDALSGQRDPRAQIELEEFIYSVKDGNLSTQELRQKNNIEDFGKNKLQIPVKRLQIYEPGCVRQPQKNDETILRLRELKHIRRSTYYRVQELAKRFSEAEGSTASESLSAKEMQNETFLKDHEIAIVAENLKRSSQILKRACLNRTLKLDLDVASIVQTTLKAKNSLHAIQTDDATASLSFRSLNLSDTLCEEDRLSLGTSAQSR